MKKLLLVLLAAAFISESMQAQTCSCNPNGWQSVVASINNTSREIKCGYQFSLKCNENITIREVYKCLGNCTVKYSAVLKNAGTGAVVMSYPVFAFPWTYHFAAAGNYSLEITPVCGDKKCTPCRFSFTVTCTTPLACDCDPSGWQPFTAYIGTIKQGVACGFQFSIKKGQPFRLAGAYKCKGTCVAKYRAVLNTNIVANSSPA